MFNSYATSRTIGEDADNVYRCGFAVAPVTMWELYHTIYTERYMLMPEDNEVIHTHACQIEKKSSVEHRNAVLVKVIVIKQTVNNYENNIVKAYRIFEVCFLLLKSKGLFTN